MGKELKIGTLNLNGEAWWLINKMRIPHSWKEAIKENLTTRTIDGLSKLLEGEKYDIIAIQELVWISDYFKIFEELIKEKGYELKKPRNIAGNTHFTVAFIFKKELGCEYHYKEPNLDWNECNKLLAVDYIINNNINNKKMEFTIVNMHLTGKFYDETKEITDKKISTNGRFYNMAQKIAKENSEKKIILLGDFNTYTQEQIEGSSDPSPNEDFLKMLVDNKYKECQKEKQYTFHMGEIWKKLDHIFVSKCMISDEKNPPPAEVDENVNFYKNKETGFTDHSMLTLYLDVEKD